MGRLRLFLALLIVDWTFGFPGVGVETRTSSNDVMDWVYGIAGLALIVALALTWHGKRFAGPLAMAVCAVAALLAVSDLFGLTAGQPAPAAMVVVDVGGIVVGAAIVWAAGRVSRRTPLTA